MNHRISHRCLLMVMSINETYALFLTEHKARHLYGPELCLSYSASIVYGFRTRNVNPISFHSLLWDILWSLRTDNEELRKLKWSPVEAGEREEKQDRKSKPVSSDLIGTLHTCCTHGTNCYGVRTNLLKVSFFYVYAHLSNKWALK